MPCFQAFVRRLVHGPGIVWLALVLALAPNPARAQSGSCTPGWQPTFETIKGARYKVNATCVFDDGHGPALFVAGRMYQAGDVAVNNIGRWDGSHWSALGAGVDGEVFSLIVFDDGQGPQLYVGGYFETAGGQYSPGIARWNGSTWSRPGGALGLEHDSLVNTMAVYDDGTGAALYAGGVCNVPGVGGVPIAVWKGAGWRLFAYVYTDIRSMVAFDDGSGPALYVGGDIVYVDNQNVYAGVVRYANHSWSVVGNEIQDHVLTMLVHDDGSGPALYAGGYLSLPGFATSFGVARWNGSAWSLLPGALPSGMYPSVEVLATFHAGAGSKLVAGEYLCSGGYCFAEWDGAAWTVFGPGIDMYQLRTLAAYDDGHGEHIYVGGEFDGVGSEMMPCIASWYGSSWRPLGAPYRGPDGRVFAITRFDDGSGSRLYCGGEFTSQGPTHNSSIATWDGANWSGVGGQAPFGDRSVRAFAVFDDGAGPALYAAGDFTQAGGLPAGSIARWNGTQWSALGTGCAACNALVVHDDGSGPALYAGATAALAAGGIARGISRWNGTNWSALGAGIYSTAGGTSIVHALGVFDDGSGAQLFVAGEFNRAGTQAANNIAHWDGQAWHALGTGTDGPVTSCVVYDDGSGPSLFVAGSFQHAGGQASPGIARWNGNSWNDVGGGVQGNVNALCVHDDGSGPALYAGGDFNLAGTAPAHGLARWDGTSWTVLDNSTGTTILALASDDDGSCAGPTLYVAYADLGGVRSTYLARWSCDAECTSSQCFGDGSPGSASCPCANTGAAGHGCENSNSSGGAELGSSGLTQNDTLVLAASGELANALSIFLQGDALQAGGVLFGDGVRCVAGTLKRLYIKSAVGGVASAPTGADASIRAQSASLGDPLSHGVTRWYQVWYRDPAPSFCPSPQGATFNITNALQVRW